MNNKFNSFSVSWKIIFLGCLLIMLTSVIVYFNKKTDWKVAGIIILICSVITLVNLITAVYEITNDALIIKTIFKTQYIYFEDMKSITLDDNLVYGTVTHVYIHFIRKKEASKKWEKVTIPSFIKNYKLLVKEIVEISENTKPIFIEDKVVKLVSGEK